MATTQGLAGLLARDSRSPDDRGDGELLKHYRDSRSEAAFDELIRRFAPLVWKVCRRTVGQRELAEDAFQAVFLVLVRKADSIRPPSSLGGWLHTVAFHTSLRARAMADRRRHAALDFEPPAAESAESIDPRWLRMLDEEIAKLPAKLRSAVTICELDGLSRSAAAARLGIAEGTVSSRLAAARKRLAERLRARGVGLSVAVGFSLLADSPAGAVPAVTGVASGVASALAAGVVRSLLLVKLKAASFAAVALAMLACGWAAFAGEPPAPDTRSFRVPILAPVPKPYEGSILVWIGDQPLLFKPDGTKLDSPEAIPDATILVRPHNAELSPDGKRIAFRGVPVPAKVGANRGVELYQGLHILPLGRNEKPRALEGFRAWNYFWLNEPDQVFVSGRDLADDGSDRSEYKSWIHDIKTGKRMEKSIPGDHFPTAISPDGKTVLLEQKFQIKDKTHHQQIHLGMFDGKKSVPLFEPGTILHSSHAPAFFPDGSKVVFRVEVWENMRPGKTLFDGDWKADRLVVVDVATRKATTLVNWEKGGATSGWKWSPDGKRIAYIRKTKVKNGDGTLSITVSDADGKNAKDVLEVESTMGHVGDTGLTLAWSPDGNRLAYIHQSAKPLNEQNLGKKIYSARVVVMNADGSNAKEVFEAKDCSWVLMGFDWK